MKRILTVLVAALVFAAQGFAQDIITTRRGETIQAKVLEVSNDQVKYVKYNYQNGPVFVLSWRDVASIRYENGDEDIFELPAPQRNYMMRAPGYTPSVRYMDIKDSYNPQDYVYGYYDRYIPWLSGLASAFIPGLGQTMCGEPLRGLAFYLGETLAWAAVLSTSTLYDGSSYDSTSIVGIGASALMIGGYIWGICDAARIAKVKNLYYRDMMGLSSTCSISVSPFIAPCVPGPLSSNSAAGLSMRLTF